MVAVAYVIVTTSAIMNASMVVNIVAMVTLVTVVKFVNALHLVRVSANRILVNVYILVRETAATVVVCALCHHANAPHVNHVFVMKIVPRAATVIAAASTVNVLMSHVAVLVMDVSAS